MQVGCRPASGLRLWDVRFGGERIVYELALQEALVSLSGATPSQARSQEGTGELDGSLWVVSHCLPECRGHSKRPFVCEQHFTGPAGAA